MSDVRAELIEAMVRAVIEDDDYWAEPESTQNCREEQGRALDSLFAHRELLFEALEGRFEGSTEAYGPVEDAWTFPSEPRERGD